MVSSLAHIYKDSNITFIEQLEIDKILKQYALDVIDIQKKRSVYKIETTNGCYCLKKIGNGEKRAIKSIDIMEYLRMKGFNKVATPVRSVSGDMIVRMKNSTYYLTNWINAEEVDFNISENVIDSVALLAEFHNKVKGYYSKKIKIKNNIGKLPRIFNDKLSLLNNFKNHLKNKDNKNDFDNLYYSNIDYYINQAQQALNVLRNSNYSALCEEYKKEMYLCHDSFYYQNILKSRSNDYYIIDLESCLYDLPVIDLGKFIRRIMWRKSFLWDFDMCKLLISKYDSIRKISDKEHEVLLAMLMFPYKFYRLGRKKYHKNKKWKEERYNRKLNKILEFREAKEDFIEKFIENYSIKT